jgi:hypothetical protein
MFYRFVLVHLIARVQAAGAQDKFTQRLGGLTCNPSVRSEGENQSRDFGFSMLHTAKCETGKSHETAELRPALLLVEAKPGRRTKRPGNDSV